MPVIYYAPLPASEMAAAQMGRALNKINAPEVYQIALLKSYCKDMPQIVEVTVIDSEELANMLAERGWTL